MLHDEFTVVNLADKTDRSTQRKLPRGRADEDRLVADMIELARQYGRYGYRRIAALPRDAGW